MNDTDLKVEIIAICQLMASGGLVAGTEGNVSARAMDGSVFMTPSGFNKGDINRGSGQAIDAGIAGRGKHQLAVKE